MCVGKAALRRTGHTDRCGLVAEADQAARDRSYTKAMASEPDPWPKLNFSGVWLCQDGLTVVHVVGIDPDGPSGLEQYLGDKGVDDATRTGTMDYFAFPGTNVPAMCEPFHTVGCRSATGCCRR